jgi:hypothetical protein
VPTKPRGGKKAVHRSLHLTSPLAKGPDVRALQEAVKKGLAHYKVDWIPLKLDGDAGPQTFHAAAFYALVIGLPTKTYRRIHQQHGPTITETVQRQLRDPQKRTRVDRIREKRRKGWLRKIRKTQAEGPKAAVAYAKSMIGVTENPAGSNSGPTVTRDGKAGGVTLWERAWNCSACFWCLCFACYCVRNIGGGKISGVCVNAAEIERMAKAHTNGWVAVPADEAKAGDISLWCFDGTGVPDHGELVVGPFHDGLSNDVGGNTSSDSSGSQSNGGGVFPKARPLSELTCVARPLY